MASGDQARKAYIFNIVQALALLNNKTKLYRYMLPAGSTEIGTAKLCFTLYLRLDLIKRKES